MKCEKCGCDTKRYDSVKRLVRGRHGSITYINVERYMCPQCKHVRRFLPKHVYPYKQYDADIIDGVIEGLISSSTYGFEDHPSESTMKRWKRNKKIDSEKPPKLISLFKIQVVIWRYQRR